MRKLFIILAATLLGLAANAQEVTVAQVPQLTDQAMVSVLTCGPGNEFYTTFGHSAIHICDTSVGVDVVYNYGTFNFGVKNFYLKFAQGRLDYMLSRGTFSNFLLEYAFEGRAVWEQELQLTTQEKQNLFLLLENNYLPDYRYYKYDFFRDNCATRVRDMVCSALDHRTLFVETTSPGNKSYRQLLYDPTEVNLLWWRFGIDLVLGQRCDKQCSNLEYMFSPIEMMHAFDTARLSDSHARLAKPPVQLLNETRQPLNPSFPPIIVFWTLCVVVVALTIIGWKKGWKLRWLDALLFWVVALISLLVLFLWFGSDHYCTKLNWNILWASPLFLYFGVRLRKSHRVVVIVQIGLLALLGLVALFGIQHFNSAVLPIAVTLFVRLLDKLRLPSNPQNPKQ